MEMATKKPAKKDISIIRECLACGIPLVMAGRPERRFSRGEITEDVRGQWLRTTHLSSNLNGYVWINGEAVAALAIQARALMARKEEAIAEQEALAQQFRDR